MCAVHDAKPELARLSRLRKSQIEGLLNAAIFINAQNRSPLGGSCSQRRCVAGTEFLSAQPPLAPGLTFSQPLPLHGVGSGAAPTRSAPRALDARRCRPNQLPSGDCFSVGQRLTEVQAEEAYVASRLRIMRCLMRITAS